MVLTWDEYLSGKMEYESPVCNFSDKLGPID